MNHSCQLRSLCPLLVPLDATGKKYDGFIVVYGNEYKLKITLPPGGKLSEAQLEGDLQLRKYLSGLSDIIRQLNHSSKFRDVLFEKTPYCVLMGRLNECASLPAFLLELQAILENQLKNHVTSAVVKPPKYYALLIDELNAIGWHRLTYVDPLLNEIHVKFTDDNGRDHILKLEFPAEYPELAPVPKADLPVPFDIHWTKQTRKALVDVFEQFEQRLRSYQLLWDLLDEVDAQMWVLEPDQPRRSDVTRRVLLGKGSSLIFTMNPLCPQMRPVWQLLGSDKVVVPLQDSLNVNSDKWDETKTLVENWNDLLKIDIPSRSASKMEVMQNECGICYAFKLGNDIPEVYCDDTRCKQIFHTVCLYEWLKAVSTSRQIFNNIFGECPYCNQAITCKVPPHS